MVVYYPNIQATHNDLLAKIVEIHFLQLSFKFLKLSGLCFQACVKLVTEIVE